MKLLLIILTVFNPVMVFASSGKVADHATQVYAASEVDRPPELMIKARLAYPPELKQKQVAGEVVVECIVDLDGSVRDPVVKSSTLKEFELPALQAVIKYKYKPARKDKERVNVRQEVTVKFEPKK